MKNITKSILILWTTFLFSEVSIAPAVTKEVELDTLCVKFPENSRCADYSSSNPTQPKTKQHYFERESFCEEYPFNSKCQQEPLEIIKLNLKSSGNDNEWIRVEKTGNTVRPIHTTQVEGGLASSIFNRAVDMFYWDLIPDIKQYNWADHQVTQVSFKSDRCKSKNCEIVGSKTIELPEQTNIHQGLFTIRYQEEDIQRSLSFRIPRDAEKEIIDTIAIEVPHQADLK